MDNKYTRKEIICPLCNDYCNKEDCNCNICISEEDKYQIQESLKDIKHDRK